MWLFTRLGFFSVSVQGQKVIIRARSKQHLQALRQRVGSRKWQIVASPHNDYGWRMVLTMEVWAGCVSELVKEQTWGNFKDEVKRFSTDRDYLDALHDIWLVMFRYQNKKRLDSRPGQKLLKEVMDTWR
jgi:hypothetical protein